MTAAQLCTRTLATEDRACPDCGALLQVVTDGLMGVLYAKPFAVNGELPTYRMEPRPFVACTGCEFCLEILS